MHDIKTSANVKRLRDIAEAAENRNYAGEKAANIACRGQAMLALLRILKVEVAGLVKFGHLHESLLHRIENEIAMAEEGYEVHGPVSNGSHQFPGAPGC